MNTIAQLNDRLRMQGDMTLGQWGITPGIYSTFGNDVKQVLQMVATHEPGPDEDNGEGERDFGSLEFNGEKVFWKIDYYDPTFTYGSDNPADPEKSRRVLTVMLASEY